MALSFTDPKALENVYQHGASVLGVTQQQFSQSCKQVQYSLKITLPFACQSLHDSLCEVLQQCGLDDNQFDISTQIDAKKTKVQRLGNIKNIIAIASGKGGVGKSTTSVNLAFALQSQGAKVGILDADIYGPSVPIMLGNPSAQPTTKDNKIMEPLVCAGLVANSIGYLIPAEDAAVWRGPMASKALQQIVHETRWPELDYLIVDMPPGTGDIQLTLSQMMPLTAAVVITTPQDIALADAKKGITMFNKVDIPVLGIVENMSYYQCTKCGNKDYVFASGGGKKLAHDYNVNLLGQLPLDISIREHADGGDPLVIAKPNDPISQTYLDIAMQISKGLAYSPTLQNDDAIPIAVDVS